GRGAGRRCWTRCSARTPACRPLTPPGGPRRCWRWHGAPTRAARGRPAAPRRADLAGGCQRHKGLHATAARLYAQAFARQPGLAGDLARQPRYNAACCAALAGCGRGKGAATLRPMDRLALRRQALTWLRADLAGWAWLAEKADAPLRRRIAGTLAHW